MHMKYINSICLIALLFSCSMLKGQQGYLDVVYLTNGSIIKGVIIEQIPNKQYTVSTSDGGRIIIKIEDIEKIAKEFPVETAKAKNANSLNTLDNLNRKWETLLEIGGGPQSGKYGLNIVKLNAFECYRLNDKFSVGAGLGLHYMPEIETTVLPLLTDFRYRFFPSKPISPYASLNAGFGWLASQSFKDAGFTFAPAIGVDINKINGMRLHAGIGYNTQQMRFIALDPNPPFGFTPIIRFSEALNFNFGISF